MTDGQRDKGWLLAFWIEHLAGRFSAENAVIHAVTHLEGLPRRLEV